MHPSLTMEKIRAGPRPFVGDLWAAIGRFPASGSAKGFQVFPRLLISAEGGIRRSIEQIGFSGRELYRQPTRGGFSTVGTIVIIHRCGLQDRSSWTDLTMPKNLEPFKLSPTGRPLYWARRQRVASRKLLVSTVCTMTSFGQATAHDINQIIANPLHRVALGQLGRYSNATPSGSSVAKTLRLGNSR